MFGRDPIFPLNSHMNPKVRYLGKENNILSLENLKNVYQVVATNLSIVRKKRDTKVPIPDKKLRSIQP